LVALRDGTLDLAVARGRVRLNSDLATMLGS
jgi:hypothetical protein